MIRRADLGDLPGIYILGRRIHQKSEDRTITLDQQKVRVHVAELITRKNGLVLVDEVDGMITGVCAGFVDELWWSKARYGIPLIVYAERPGAFVWMVRRFIRWAFEQKCAVQVVLDQAFGGALGEKAEKLLQHRRIGAERVGASLIVRKDL